MSMLVHLILPHIFLRASSFFFFFFSLFFGLISILKFAYSFSVISCLLLSHSKVPHMPHYCSFQLPKFHLFLFYNLFVYWYNIVIIPFFTSLIMVFFNSENMFIMVTLKSFYEKSNIWSLSQAVSVTCFVSGVSVILSYLFAFFIIFFVGNWTF